MTRTLKALLLALAAGLLLRPGQAATDPKTPDYDGAKRPRVSGGLTELARSQGGSAPEPEGIAGIDDRHWVVLQASGRAARTRIATAGVSIEMVDGGTVAGVADAETIRRLEREGVKVVSKKPLSAFGPEDFPTQDGDFHNPAELDAALQSIAGSMPGQAEVFPIGKSTEGRSLTALRFHRDSGKADAAPKPGIAFLGTHHAREHLSTEVPLLIARWIAENRSREDVKRLLETRDIYFIPLVNPDGVEYDIATARYRWHRKNMRANGDGSIGVDLNRNYAFRWGGEGSSGNPGSDTYHGPSAFSEPETLAVKNFLTARPNIRIVLSYHTFSELVLYPWGGTDEPISDGRALGAFKAMAQKMAGWTGYRPMQSSELYVATGDTCDWAWAELSKFCFTFELTPKSMWDGGFYPGAGAIQSTFKKNIEPALYLIDLADDPYRAGGGDAAALPADEPAEAAPSSNAAKRKT